MPVLAHDVYTYEPNAGPYVIFPTHAHQILSNCIHIVGVSILSYCLASRTEPDRLLSWAWWTSLSRARLLIIFVFVDSWIFLAVSGVLVNGVGLSESVPVCSLGIFVCILFYAGSKALIYLFLAERVWIVCSAGKPVTRLESRIYKGCVIIVCGYLAIVVGMILGRYAQVRDDGACVIGLQNFATIPLVTYDLFINIFLTSLFIWFIYREQSISDRLQLLARRTAIASGIALTTSCVNILMLAVLHGHQLGWVCLGSCATDVTVNAVVLFWVTAGPGREPGPPYWERKDGLGGLGDLQDLQDLQDLPPLNFPASFVADPELGLNASRGRSQSIGRSAGRVERGEPLRERNLCEGCSRDVRRSGRSRGACGEIKEATLENSKWDLSDPSSSGTTRFVLDEKEGGEEVDDQPWRLTLDFDRCPTTLLSRHPQFEPDSPASLCTARSNGSTGSSARLSGSIVKQQEEEQRQKQEKQPKQRLRRWRSRPRRTRSHSQSVSSPSPPPHHSDLPFSSPPLLPHKLPNLPRECILPSLPSHSMQVPLGRTHSSRRLLLRSHSDSLFCTSQPPRPAAMPRFSQ